MINYDVLQMAASQIGTLEWKRGSNPKVEEYLAHGFSKSNKKTSLTDSVPWCLSGEIEILTDHGFKRFDECDKSELVAQVDPTTLQIDFVKPRTWIKKDYKGKLYQINHRNLSVRCDSGHQWFGRFNNSKNVSKKTLDDVNYMLSIPRPSGKSEGTDLTNKTLFLFAAFLSDGSIRQNKGKNTKKYIVLEVSKQRKIDALRSLGPQHEYTQKKVYGNSRVPLTVFTFVYPDEFDHWQDDYKILSRNFIMSLSQKSAEAFLDYYLIFDGNTKQSRKSIYTSRQKLADQIQEIALYAGKYTSVYSSNSPISGKPCYTINISPAQEKHIKSHHIFSFEGEETLYCVNVDKGLIVCRDSEKNTFITGNCAGFVAWCLEKCGRESTNSLMARSYENWGVSTKKDPLPGDIVVFYRSTKASGKGHVGFFVGFSSEGNILCLGGNQNDAVNITEYGLGRMTDIRRSSKAPKYSKTEIKKLESLADKILSGAKIEPPGSVV